MANKIQIKRGYQADLPQLDLGEPAFTVDTKRLYLGNPPDGNILVNIGDYDFDLVNGADGYIAFFIGPNKLAGDNDFFWDRENNRLGIHTTTPTHELTIDGYIVPATDNIHRLGTPEYRWEALHLGPNSLHISSSDAETGTAFDWTVGIDQTTGNEGKLLFVQGERQFLSIDPITEEIKFPVTQLTADGSFKLAEVTAPLNEAGYGIVYVSSADNKLHFINSSGADIQVGDTSGLELTVQEHYVQHGDAIQTIVKDLDGYLTSEDHSLLATKTELSGLDQTVQEKFSGQSEVNNDILGALDGYTTPDVSWLVNTVQEHYDGQGLINNDIIKACDGYTGDQDLSAYALDTTEQEHYFQLGDAIQIVIKSLDGYNNTAAIAGLDATVQSHKLAHETDTKAIIDALDGYSGDLDLAGLTQTVQDHKTAHETDIKSIIDVLDGYSAPDVSWLVNTVQEHYDEQGLINDTIIKDLDGYLTSEDHSLLATKIELAGLDQTVQEHSDAHGSDIKAIIDVLDGYATSGGVSETTFQEFKSGQSEINNDIIKSLDGYTGGGGGVISAQGADGYLAFFTGPDAIAGDNDLFYDRVNGRLGIGTNSPTHTLEVITTDNYPYFARLSADTNVMRNVFELVHKTSANMVDGFGCSMVFTAIDSSGTPWQLASLGAIRAGADDSGRMLFRTINAGVTTEKMTIMPDGDVGIQTSDPDSKLHIDATTAGDGGTFNGSGSAVHIKQNTAWSASQPWALFVEGYTYLNGFRINANSGTGSRALYKTDAGGQLGFATASSDPITFTTNDSIERMRINGDGNVGIGTGWPHEKLTVNGRLALQSGSAPGTEHDVDGYGTLYVNSSDNDLYYQYYNESPINLTTGGGTQDAPKYTITASKTGVYTASFDEVVRSDPSGGAFTITLPAANGGAGQTIIVKNTTSSTNTITIQGTGGELIDSQSSVEIAEGYKSLTFVSYGSEWGII